MRLLLDTHVAIWAVSASDRLSPTVVDLISNQSERVYVSFCSLWEIAIKSSMGRRKIAPFSPDRAQELFLEANFSLLEIKVEHILAVPRLPDLHGDPFDRLIVAQAMVEPLRLVTHDKSLTRYSDTIIHC